MSFKLFKSFQLGLTFRFLSFFQHFENVISNVYNGRVHQWLTRGRGSLFRALLHLEKKRSSKQNSTTPPKKKNQKKKLRLRTKMLRLQIFFPKMKLIFYFLNTPPPNCHPNNNPPQS